MGKRATERSAACATCGKTFARSDTLLRHEKSHHATEDRGPIHRVTNGTFRACVSCAQARSRCSGGVPCGRCKTRGLECAYPNKRRKGLNNEDDGQSTLHMMEVPPTSQGDASKMQPQYPGGFQQFVFTPTSSSSYTGAAQPDLGQVSSMNEGPSVQPLQMPNEHSGHLQHDLTTNIPMASTQVQQMPMVNPNFRSVPNEPPQQHYTNSSAPVNYEGAFDDSNAAYAGNSLYDESLNLNWIPLSIYPSPYGDMEQDFSFLLPSLSDTASISNDFDSLTFGNNLMASSGRSGMDASGPSQSYRPPASVSGLIQSPASTNSDHNNFIPAGFTFDQVDVPDPKKKLRKQSHVPTGFQQSKSPGAEYAFPDMSLLSSSSDQFRCPETKYLQVVATFQRLCVKSSRWKPFSSPEFPSLATFNTCIDLYFEHQHQTFPLIHAASFERNAAWLTCLATAAIGSTFADIPNCADAREAFQELLRRAVLATTDEHDGDFRNMHLAQARILALVGLAQSDREQLRSRAPRAHADIARWCLESSILQLTGPDEAVRSDEDLNAAWDRWIQQESLRRVGYFIWLLDCALGYISNARPLCNMDDARAPLPCPDDLWDASEASEWLMHRNNTPRMPSLCEAMETMYNKKKVDPQLSEVSHILLIHALYSRTWEVGTHIKQPLSEWKATGNSTGFLNTPSKDNFWLPLYPLYANWRNSACDCLDVLDWQATATKARNAGSEHHGVLHLHLARVILLTPFQEIQDLLFFLINHRVSDLSKASFYVHDGSYQPRNPAKLPQIRKITWRWLREDQHKARLAVIHAGSVFWHVRRYSTYSFFEPLAVYLASIVLWTYGSYKSAALERDAAAAHGGVYSHSRLSSSNDRSQQVQIEPGNDFHVQPTRVEKAAQDYADSKSRSSRSRSDQNTNPSGANSPAQPRNYNGTIAMSETNYLSNNSPMSVGASGYGKGPNANNSHIANQSGGQNITAGTKAHNNENENENEDENNEGSDNSEDDEDDQPKFIHLDRPCDDEIIQHFVRNGYNMAGYMSNVGDICQTPQKVLLEGAKILRTKLACWGVSREYHDILTRLAEMRKDKEKGRHR